MEQPRSVRDEVDRLLASEACPFSMVSEEARADLAAAMDVRDYDAGELLVRQGERGRFLLVLLDGTASARVRQSDGAVTSIAELHAGSLVGEMSLVTNEARTADVVCQTQVRAALLSVDAFNDLALEYPELRALLTEVVAERLGQSAVDSLSGKDIHGYRIARCVGRGGMGIVYEAVSTEEGRRVALKMMNHRLVYQPRALQRFQREADTIKSLDHRAIARLYTRFSAYRTQFLVLEFCEGVTLASVIREYGPLDEGIVRRIVGQLADALRYVHERGMIHRDLKPSNIMLSGDGPVKLLDFGIAISDRVPESSPMTDTTTVSTTAVECIGTPQYMAPEQFGSHALDHRVDWYGLAVIAYEALTGRPTVSASDLFAAIKERQEFAVPPASEIGRGVSAEMHEFLVNALRYGRDERIVDLRQLAQWAGPVILSGERQRPT
jgi:CRP-like cAMP-binding protein